MAVLDRILKYVDVLVGNEEDLQKGLGIPGPEVTASAANATKSKLDPSAFFGMIDNVIAKHPQIKIVATTLREVHSTNRHSWSAVAWVNGQTFTAPTAELDVYDRIGGGDTLHQIVPRHPVDHHHTRPGCCTNCPDCRLNTLAGVL